jgi:hypothetical protein
LLAYGILAVFLIAPPDPSTPPMNCYTTLVCGTFGLADAILNLGFFVPLGFLLVRSNLVRGFWLLAASPLFSLGLEAIQVVSPGRTPSMGDVLFNGAGGVLGIVAARTLQRGAAYSARRVAWAGIAWAITSLVAFTTTALMLQVTLPDTTYWGQWTPRLEHLEPYTGRVLSAEIGHLPLASSRLDDSRAVRESLQSAEPLRVSFLVGGAPRRLASVFSIADEDSRSILLVGADRREFVYRIALRASSFRLHAPDLRIPFPDVMPGDTLTVIVKQKPPTTEITLAGHRIIHPGPTVGRGWAFLLPLPHVGDTGRGVLDMLWLGFWALPLGLLYRRGYRSMVGVATVATGLALLPGFSGLAPMPIAQWSAFAAAFVIGVWLARKGRRGSLSFAESPTH